MGGPTVSHVRKTFGRTGFINLVKVRGLACGWKCAGRTAWAPDMSPISNLQFTKLVPSFFFSHFASDLLKSYFVPALTNFIMSTMHLDP